MTDKTLTVAALRVIGALATKAAMDVEQGRLWPGDLTTVTLQIQKALRDVKE